MGTCDALLFESHTLQSALESGQEARIVQIDFRAAFDRVNHQGILYKLSSVICSLSSLGVRIQPTPALRRVVRGDYLRDMSYPLPPAHCMQGLLACSGTYELG